MAACLASPISSHASGSCEVVGSYSICIVRIRATAPLSRWCCAPSSRPGAPERYRSTAHPPLNCRLRSRTDPPPSGMYNVFRLTGDGLHCLALIVLFIKMNQTGSCAGARPAPPLLAGILPRAQPAAFAALLPWAAGHGTQTCLSLQACPSRRRTCMRWCSPAVVRRRPPMSRPWACCAAARRYTIPCSQPVGRLLTACHRADLDLITMWFIELPEGTSLWEYTSVRTTPPCTLACLPARLCVCLGMLVAAGCC
jgi:hypothetical protein